MPTNDPYGFNAAGNILLEAEVAASVQTRFIQRYQAAAGTTVSAGNPQELQLQSNKWGAECRIYFNSVALRDWAQSQGIHVETGRPYQPNYQFRINNNDLWWELVEDYQFRLGIN